MRAKKNYIEFCYIILSILIIFKIVNYKPFYAEVKFDKHIPKTEYGINMDNLQIFRDTIKSGQTLSTILSKWGITVDTIDLLVKKANGIFDFKNIKAGKPYSIIYPSDSIKKALYMVYEESYSKYIVFVLKDSIHVHYGMKDVLINEKQTFGIINSSLWDAIESSEAGIDLAIKLSDIYAWSIDFYDLKKGDWFKAIYEEISIDKEAIATGKVLASIFYNNGKEYYAFWFVKDSIGEYYDKYGKSLKRAFLKAPLQFTRISSRFSYSRMHPILKYRRPHLGIDYSAPAGTPVVAVGAGYVVKAGLNGQAGLMVKIRHNAGYETAYFHLSKLAKGIKNGSKVSQGQIIGYVGSSGLSTGPHLDFRFYKNGKAVDPLKIESPPAKPVDSVDMPEFIKIKDKMIEKLNKIELKEKILQ